MDQLSAPERDCHSINGGGPIPQPGNFLRPRRQHLADGAGLSCSFIAQFMFIGYICAYYVNVGNKSSNAAVSAFCSR